MNVNKLYKGQQFKNYKDLCEVLEMEVKKSTKSKHYQMKELERYCSFHKDGHKIVIDEVYSNPFPKEDGRKDGNNSVYGNFVQLLILDLLAQTKGKVSISMSKLLRTLNITNINYGFGSSNVPKLAKFIDTSEMIVHDFYNTTSGNFRDIVKRSLKQLEDKRIIICDKVTKVCDIKNNHRLATDEEKEIILECEKYILDEMGFRKVSQIIALGRWKEYRKRSLEKIKDKINIHYHYSAYDISVNKKYIEEEINGLVDLLLEDVTREEYKDELNATVCVNLLNSAKMRHEKAFTSKRMSKYRITDTYVDKINKLINILIDNNTPNLINLLIEIEEDEKFTDEELEMFFA